MCTQPSPSIVGFRYDVMTKRLDVSFADGSLRQYRRIPRSVYAAMRMASNSSEFFRQNVLGRFAYTVPTLLNVAA